MKPMQVRTDKERLKAYSVGCDLDPNGLDQGASFSVSVLSWVAISSGELAIISMPWG